MTWVLASSKVHLASFFQPKKRLLAYQNLFESLLRAKQAIPLLKGLFAASKVFFSYHWPSWERLGPDGVQRRAMNHSLELYSEQEKHPLEKLWVWLAPRSSKNRFLSL